nr:DNA helicase [Tanacetum cinerariifolium]
MRRIKFRKRDRLDIIVNMPDKKKTTLIEWLASKSGQNKEIPWKTDLRSSKLRRSLLLAIATAACEALGLLGDDKEWDIAFEESIISTSSAEVRNLFAQILIYYDVSDLPKLWKKHWQAMRDDIPTKVSEVTGILNYQVNTPQLQEYILYELEAILNGFRKSVKEFGLPPPPERLLKDLKNKLLMEERNYSRDLLMQDATNFIPKLNHDQKEIYDLIINASEKSRQELVFVYGHGGTGKTFLWKTIISSLRSQGKIVLAVASSSIASLLLPVGRTTHSRFKLPLDLTDETLRDLMNANEIPFGGKTIVLGGDFWQTLPVKKGDTKEELIHAFIAQSYLWLDFKICTLKENMRLLRSGVDNEERKHLEVFAKWLLDVGNGETDEPDQEDDQDTSWITILSEYCITPNENGLSEFIDFIYDGTTLNTPTACALQEKAIVCPKNDTVDVVNARILSSIEGVTTYLSRNEAIPMGKETSEIEMLYRMEFLNTITFLGFPPYELRLKDDLAKQFNKEEIEKLSRPVIIAVSSCRVTKYKDTDVQLAATPTTYYYINPQTREDENAYTMFKGKYNLNPPLQVSKNRYDDLE